MEDKDPLFNETVQLIYSDFEEEKMELLNKNNFGSFQEALTNVVRHMLYHNYKKLINILYKMDVDEKKYTQLFKDLPSDKISNAVADLIIERAREKAAFRQKYRKN
jgi:hypothetical protein